MAARRWEGAHEQWRPEVPDRSDIAQRLMTAALIGGLIVFAAAVLISLWP